MTYVTVSDPFVSRGFQSKLRPALVPEVDEIQFDDTHGAGE